MKAMSEPKPKRIKKQYDDQTPRKRCSCISTPAFGEIEAVFLASLVPKDYLPSATSHYI